MTNPDPGTTHESDEARNTEASEKSHGTTPPGGDSPDPDFQEGATIPAASD